MVYYLVTQTAKDDAKKITLDTGKKYYQAIAEICPRLNGKLKADLVREGAKMAQVFGVNECWIYNITQWSEKIIKDGKRVTVSGFTLNQSWYVFNDGQGWFFKMRAECVAKHPITGAL